MHVLLIYQAFASLDEAGGTRHYEMALHLMKHGHQVTIISSPVSYLTGKSRSTHIHWKEQEKPQPGITILRAFTYQALHKSFIHRIFSFISFMFSSFWIGLGVKHVDLVWGTSPPIFQGLIGLAACPAETRSISCSRYATSGLPLPSRLVFSETHSSSDYPNGWKNSSTVMPTAWLSTVRDLSNMYLSVERGASNSSRMVRILDMFTIDGSNRKCVTMGMFG